MSAASDDIEKLRLYDKRVLRRNIKKGLLSSKDLEAHLKSLPDVAAKVAPPEPLPAERPAAPARPAADPLPGSPVSAETVAAVTADVMAALQARNEAARGLVMPDLDDDR